MRAVIVLALAVALPGLSGCLGLFGDEAEAALDDAALADVVGNATAARIEARAALVPRNYTFPDQRELPQVVVYKNGTVDAAALAAYEDRNDRGGNRYGVLVQADDYSGLIPAGQPVELSIKLSMAMQAGASADVDLYVDVPGTKTDWDPSSQDEFNWKFTAKAMSVSTLGVPGARHDIGVAISNGRIAPGSSLSYTLRIEATYLKDVLTPHLPWALQVPPNATGLVFDAVKGDGPENVRAKFVVIGPDDEKVGIVDFNDLSVSTVFVPTKGPGEYVFYAWEMTGGFLEVQADVPVPDRLARPLALQETAVALGAEPTPGLPQRDWTHRGLVTPPVGGSTASFAVTGTFPLRVVPTIGEGATGAAEVRISSPAGLVSYLQRVARVDQGGNSLGYTQDAFNQAFHPEALQKGEYQVSFVNDSPNTPLGYVVLTYVRT